MTERRPGTRRLMVMGGKIIAVPLAIHSMVQHGTLSIVVPTDHNLAPQVLDLMTGEIAVLRPWNP